MTAVVLIVVTVTKFTHGAWIVFVLMPVLFLLMMGVHRYYRDVEKEIEVDPTTLFGAAGDHAIVLVGRMSEAHPEGARLRDRGAKRHDRGLHVVHSTTTRQKRARGRVGESHNINVKLTSFFRRRTATLATPSSSTSRRAAKRTAPKS